MGEGHRWSRSLRWRLSPAQRARLVTIVTLLAWVGDELVAMDGWRLRRSERSLLHCVGRMAAQLGKELAGTVGRVG